MADVERLTDLVGVLLRENQQLRDLVKSAGDHMLALAAPMQRTAKASEEIAARENTVMWQMAQDIAAIRTALAVQGDNLKDVQREITGAHPLVPLEVDDTDKAIGKFVRGIFKRGWTKIVAAAAGGLTTGGLIHWLIAHLSNR